MGKVLIVGCGGVASVAVHKCCQNSKVFDAICMQVVQCQNVRRSKKNYRNLIMGRSQQRR